MPKNIRFWIAEIEMAEKKEEVKSDYLCDWLWVPFTTIKTIAISRHLAFFVGVGKSTIFDEAFTPIFRNLGESQAVTFNYL